LLPLPLPATVSLSSVAPQRCVRAELRLGHESARALQPPRRSGRVLAVVEADLIRAARRTIGASLSSIYMRHNSTRRVCKRTAFTRAIYRSPRRSAKMAR
jgi:hypothetical protein